MLATNPGLVNGRGLDERSVARWQKGGVDLGVGPKRVALGCEEKSPTTAPVLGGRRQIEVAALEDFELARLAERSVPLRQWRGGDGSQDG